VGSTGRVSVPITRTMRAAGSTERLERLHRRTARPGFPQGDVIHLPGRGDVFCRVHQGSPGGPAALLVHGWTSWSDATWHSTYQPMVDAGWTLVAPDLPGHADGLRTDRFHLSEVADDLATLVTTLGVGPVVACGYSMGGPISLLLAERAPEVVTGLVLAATAARFDVAFRDHALFAAARSGLRAAAVLPESLLHWISSRVLGGVKRSLEATYAWAREDVVGHHWPTVYQAACDLARFDHRTRLADFHVPAVVVATTRDRTVPLCRQRELAAGLGAEVLPLHADHAAPLARGDAFARSLVGAATLVAA
jgi:pimeloyl-ACP methyl ester carboxylesterase